MPTAAGPSIRPSSPARVGVGVADVDRIDMENILNASLWAMAQAVARLDCSPKLVLIDGNKAPRLDCATRTIVQGDARCLSIAAASIVAKVVRDAMMAELARDYPHYGFDRHKGYGTREHHAAIAKHGVTRTIAARSARCSWHWG